MKEYAVERATESALTACRASVRASQVVVKGEHEWDGGGVVDRGRHCTGLAAAAPGRTPSAARRRARERRTPGTGRAPPCAPATRRPWRPSPAPSLRRYRRGRPRRILCGQMPDLLGAGGQPRAADQDDPGCRRPGGAARSQPRGRRTAQRPSPARAGRASGPRGPPAAVRSAPQPPVHRQAAEPSRRAGSPRAAGRSRPGRAGVFPLQRRRRTATVRGPVEAGGDVAQGGEVGHQLAVRGRAHRRYPDSLLRLARSQAIPGVGAALYPGQACCEPCHCHHRVGTGQARPPCGCGGHTPLHH